MSRHRSKPDRDKTIDAAIRAGKIRAANADEYRAMWDANPDAINHLLTAPVEKGGLLPGLVGSGEDPSAVYDESWLTDRERQALASRRTAPASAPAPTPATPAPAQAASPAPEEGDDSYDDTWLSGEERDRISAAKDGTLTHGRVEFEDTDAKRAAGAASAGR